MENTYWHKQTAEKPLFPDMLWSKPENKSHAGKLLIIGGNLHGFAAAAEAYNQATKAGIAMYQNAKPTNRTIAQPTNFPIPFQSVLVGTGLVITVVFVTLLATKELLQCLQIIASL